MKFYAIANPVHDYGGGPLKKILLVMKLTVFLLIIAFAQAGAKGYSQITLHEKDAPFEKIMASIIKQTGYTVFYDEHLRTGPISIDVDRASVSETLDKCFSNLPIAYKIVGNNIFLKKKEVVSLPAIVPLTPPASVSGIILNEDKKPVEGVSVVIAGTSNGTKTDAKGYFRLYDVPDNAVLRISSIGYRPVEIGIRKAGKDYKAYAIDRMQAENLKSGTGENVVFTLRLVADIGILAETLVKGEVPKQVGTIVELKHRSHLNLGQVLEGSVPGLTLKNSTTTQQVLSFQVPANMYLIPGIDNVTFTGIDGIRDLYNRFAQLGLNGGVSFDEFYRQVYLGADNNPNTLINGTFGHLTTTTTNNGLVPELRGSSGFTGNTTGMMVVIDGVEQSNFPSNYPMNNVARIEVVKDPAELIKWGPKATGGLILITTNGAKAGKLQVDYTLNFYHSGKPDISNSRLQLASSADILAYYKEQVDKGLAGYITGDNPVGIRPAQELLYNLKKNNLPYSNPRFVASWDSLANLSNRDQLRLLYQNVFMQSHSLNIAGGTRAYRFNLGGIYSNSPGTAVGDKATNLNLNLQNMFSLLKNKLRINWQLNTVNSNSQSSAAGNGAGLDPYQLLLNPQDGGYVYDYSGSVNYDTNRAMRLLGYMDYGANPLEDALNTKNTNKVFSINSRLNMDWELAKGLQWSTAFVYTRGKGSTRNLQGEATSFVRQLRDNYGSPDSTSGVIFYVPQGSILNTSSYKNIDWNLRSGLSYNHNFDARNVLNVTFGIAATNTQNSATPNTALYGYSPNHPMGLPILSAPDGILNYLGAAQYPSQLLVPGFNTASRTRGFSLNGNLAYSYDSRYTLIMRYGSVYTPNPGFIPSYSGTKNYEATASWQISKERFFKLPFISTMSLSAIAGKIQMGKAPDLVISNPIAQPLWNNTALVASGYTISQLNGQGINNMGGALQIGLWQERVHLYAAYNHSSDGSRQVNGQVVYDIYREPWFNIPFISRLIIDASLQNFNALQAQAIAMGTNAPMAGGGFSLATNNNFGVLPPATINKEAHVSLGLFKDRLIFDVRYYHKIISSTSGSGLLPPDPSTGLGSQLSYSRLLNKGMEFYLRGKAIQGPDFSYAITVNGAYNLNQALDVPDVPFSQYASYLTSPHTGYATDALWSYRWAGLDNQGNPQVYKDKDTKVPILSGTDANGMPKTTVLDASSLIYSGRTRAPWSGGLTQEWQYKNFFASARLAFNLGYVMRTYIPVASQLLDKNILIGQRWQKPGDEAYTDIAAMAQSDPTRALVIQNSSNSIVSADNIRLREIQFGYEVPASVFKKNLIKALTISAQIENVALWTRNKLGLDPEAVGSNGTALIRQPRQYVLTINASF